MFQAEIELSTKGRGTYDITSQVAAAVQKAGVATGLCHVFVTHTSASLMLCENADPDVRRELESHRRFRQALDLPFRLLADIDQTVCHAYEVLGLFGINTRRVTFVVGRDGRIAGVAKATLRMQTHDALLRRVLARSI